ncbi:hypothetical protein B7P43_G14835 [Cryptotermes secundus]|uniref:Mos1 transposase HTH domain-containing protein n=1 Tax=Cryptotermes secundus TaxID=105785 RepID=A0A2J7RJC3_9NEOP|nr:hypothetical protein B7P43_G14835 [Cryptotermes secundus]
MVPADATRATRDRGSTESGSLDVSQPYGTPRRDTRTALRYGAQGCGTQNCYQGLREACGDAALPYRTVARWVKLFHEGRDAIQMTAHHPAANRLVEHFHWTLKAAIMCPADQQWTEVLPLVLLGTHTAFKEDLQASVAELMYSEPLRIPGELLIPTADPVAPAHLISELCQHMACLRPVLAACHASLATFTHSDLKKGTQVFLQQDRMLRALEPLTAAPTRPCHGEREETATRVWEAHHCVSQQGQAGLHPKKKGRETDHRTTCHAATVLHKNYTFCSPERLGNNLCGGGDVGTSHSVPKTGDIYTLQLGAWLYIYIYIYIEREREREVYICIHSLCCFFNMFICTCSV